MNNDIENLTLRDFFAASALTGLIPNSSNDSVTVLLCAREAYLFADAMLKERKRNDQ
jgi:hypothetical protein